MTDNALRELLHEIGDEQPPVPVDPGTFRRGRRSHRRGLVTRVAVAAAVVVAGAAVTVPLGGDGNPQLPAGSDAAPAMPSRLHRVPERLASHLGGDDEGYRWHSGLAADSLAVGTTAAVFPVNMGAVVAVSALDGSYRGLDLPGFDEASYFRFQNVAVALSPDGNRLAYTWNPDVIGGSRSDGYRPSGVRIVELATGRVESVRIRGGFGVFAHGFSWSPDGRYLAYNLDVTTGPDGRVRGGRNFVMERLDTRTGDRTPVPGMPRSDTGPAVSRRGEVAVVGNGSPRTWLPGRTPEVRKFEGNASEWTAAWSGDGDLVAAGSWQHGWFSVGDPDGLGLLTGTADSAPAGSMVRVLGWVDDDEVALLHQTDGERRRVSAVPARSPRGGDGRTLVDVDPGVPILELSLATGLLDRPSRDFPAPEWPTDWPRVGGWVAGVVAVLLVAGLWLRLRRRP